MELHHVDCPMTNEDEAARTACVCDVYDDEDRIAAEGMGGWRQHWPHEFPAFHAHCPAVPEAEARAEFATWFVLQRLDGVTQLVHRDTLERYGPRPPESTILYLGPVR